MTEIINIFTSTSKMSKFQYSSQFRVCCKLIFEDVFNSLDVVVGSGFNFFDIGCIVEGEIDGDGVQEGSGFGGEGGDFLDTVEVAEHGEPAAFYQDTGFDEAIFRKGGAKAGDFGGVATVERADGGEL